MLQLKEIFMKYDISQILALPIVFLLTLFLSIQPMNPKRLSIEEAKQKIHENIIVILESMLGEDPRGVKGWAIKKRTLQRHDMPGYIIKLATDAIGEAEKTVLPCIKKENLSLLYVPKMWEVKISLPSTLPERLQNIWIPTELCLAEFIKGTIDEEMTLEQAKQIEALILKADKSYFDCKNENFVYMPNKQIALIDLEGRGFLENTEKNKLFALSRLYTLNRLSRQAEEYLRKYK